MLIKELSWPLSHSTQFGLSILNQSINEDVYIPNSVQGLPIGLNKLV